MVIQTLSNCCPRLGKIFAIVESDGTQRLLWILFADFTVVEPKHTMYLNNNYGWHGKNCRAVEPKHTMYLNWKNRKGN